MISVIEKEVAFFRSFGWVQDPSNFRSLCNVVAVFDENSEVHKILKSEVLPRLVSKEDGLDGLLEALERRPVQIEYNKLVGTTPVPRNLARCNAIIQATVKGQGREFIGDWPADNFVRWAHAFGFLQYHYQTDSFSITEAGRRLSAVRPEHLVFPSDSKEEELSKEETLELTNAILAYPPASRILSLLMKENTHLTKFEIGKQLGFIGEGGFTSLPQNLLLQALATAETTSERSKMRMDWDGSSDKYARMIGKWLTKLKLVTQEPKYFKVPVYGQVKEEMIGQAFRITAQGYTAMNRSSGSSKHRKIPKNLCFEMLAAKGNDREFLRTRRAYIIKCLEERNTLTSSEEIQSYLENVGIHAGVQTILDDIQGIQNIGICILEQKGKFLLDDVLNDFIIPVRNKKGPTDLEEIKEELRAKLKLLSHEYLSLLDLAYDSKQNRLFEMKVIQLLTEECGFVGYHLGGSRRPDGILYIETCEEGFGIILDTKAYTNGYNLPISDADEMERYLRENAERNEVLNPNLWWEAFPGDIKKFHYLFVAGHFRGNYEAQIERLNVSGNVTGAAISVIRLLELAEMYKRNIVSSKNIEKILFFGQFFDEIISKVDW